MPTRRRWIQHCAAAAAALSTGAAAQALTVRLGLSATTMGEFNPNDAKAAFKVWGEAVQRQTGVSITWDQSPLFDTPALVAGIRAGKLDAFGGTLNEFRQVMPLIEPASVILDQVTIAGGHEYLILAHKDRKFTRLADLRGRQMLGLKSPPMALAEDWLDVLLAEQGLGPYERFFGQFTWNPKLSKVVLPVYFQQADCCVATAAAFATMCELNPQLAATLVVVARSPKLVAAIMALHKACDAPAREAFVRALLGLHESATGRQVLTLFQSKRLYVAKAAALGPSLELSAAAAKLRGGRAEEERMRTAATITRRACLGALAGVTGAGAAATPVTVRLGFSSSLMGDFNQNDAKAAFGVWADGVHRQTGVRAVFDSSALFDTAAMVANVRAGRLDAFVISINEYRQVAEFVEPNFVLYDEATASRGQEYVILAHQARNLTLGGLRGRPLLVWKSMGTALAEDWLDVLLAQHGLGAPDRFFAPLSPLPKLSKAVLPVYFQQADACLATTAGFESMCELNPQLGKALAALARSPQLVSHAMCIHKACPPAVRDAFVRAALGIHQSAVGRQVLMLFQMQRLMLGNASAMGPSLELAAAAARVRSAGRRRIG